MRHPLPARSTLGTDAPGTPFDGWLYLVRHGRTALNAADRLRGHLDPPLDDTGIREAGDLPEAIPAELLSRIVSSPLQRALRTAQILAAHTQVEVVIDDRLIDRDYGPLTGKPRAMALAESTNLDDVAGVEPTWSVTHRAREALDDQIPFLTPDRAVAMVAHDAINRYLLAELNPALGPPEEISQRTACWNLLGRTDSKWVVDQLDQKLH